MADIEKRGENSWRLTVSLGAGPKNKKFRERKTIKIEDSSILKSPRKLEAYLNEEWLKFKIEVETGAYISPEKMKLSDFIEEWKDKYASDPKNLSPGTLANYENIIEDRIIPYFGHMRIDQIKALQIVTWLKDMEKPGMRRPPKSKKPLTDKQLEKANEPLDSETIAIYYRVLKNIFTRAVEWKVIAENPMEGIKRPAAKNAREKMIAQKNNPQYYSEEEAQIVVDALYKESTKWRLYIFGSLFGGCRRGELLGLEWPFVKYKDRVLSIENNIPFTKGGEAVEKGPKSITGYRDTDMPEWYMDDLKRYEQEWIREKEWLGDKWEGGDRQFVFHNGKGKPYYYKHPSRWWERFCKRHGIRYIKFHGLRHSSGTLLLEDEEETNFDSILMAIQKRLGHARLSTTTDTYVHVTKKVKQRAAAKFDKFYRPPVGSEKNNIGVQLGSETRLKRVK